MEGRNGMLFGLQVLREIWINRNHTLFRQKLINIQVIVEDVKIHSWRWLRARRKGFTYSLTSWISNPRNVLEKVQYIF